jgi:hypothetical protein
MSSEKSDTTAMFNSDYYNVLLKASAIEISH